MLQIVVVVTVFTIMITTTTMSAYCIMENHRTSARLIKVRVLVMCQSCPISDYYSSTTSGTEPFYYNFKNIDTPVCGRCVDSVSSTSVCGTDFGESTSAQACWKHCMGLNIENGNDYWTAIVYGPDLCCCDSSDNAGDYDYRGGLKYYGKSPDLCSTDQG